MKIYRLVFVVLLGVLTQMAYAASSEPLTITFKNEELSSVFKRLEKQTSYMFLFAYDDVSGYKVEGKLRDASFKQVMDYILKNTPLTYTVEDKIVNIFLKKLRKTSRRRSLSADGLLPEMTASRLWELP